MENKRLKGKFITFEGSEGCGKSTQSRLLYDYLKNKGVKVVYLREPGATEIGEKIRRILLDSKNKAITPECEMLLYMAARAQVVDEVIMPALNSGKTIICDRFLDSTIAYQGYGLGLDMKTIECTGKFATYGIKPDLTIFLDLPLEVCLRRVGKKDRIEKRPFSYHERVRSGYLALAAKFPRRFKIIRADRDRNNIQARIRKLVDNVF